MSNQLWDKWSLLVSEEHFREVFYEELHFFCRGKTYDFVTGPGRSGAIASVYASHYLGVPFVPYKHARWGSPLVVDTAVSSGRTLRKASRFYDGADTLYAFFETPNYRVKFWYEQPSIERGKGNEYKD